MAMKNIVNSIKNMFDWTPVAVSEPIEIYRDYKDKGHVLLGYEVTVTYKYHGERRHLFADDEEKLCMVTRAQARKMAYDFYREKLQKIK